MSKFTSEHGNMADNEQSTQTIFLPKTTFPIKQKHQEVHSECMAQWSEMDIYNFRHRARRRDDSDDSDDSAASDDSDDTFVLHDGPPYANGHLHMGHALNKVLKDIIASYHYTFGKRVSFVPGWDCHGLPIEWKVEQEFRSQNIDKKDVSALDFRNKCREFATHWIAVQKEEFKQLGIVSADWDNPYLTMDRKNEARIVQTLLTLTERGCIYKANRPVLWSCIEETSLAEAEVVYQNHKSTSAYIAFPVVGQDKTFCVIWTTTPWTLPANQAIAFQAKAQYGMYEVLEGPHKGYKLVLCNSLALQVLRDCECKWTQISDNVDVSCWKCHSPLRDGQEISIWAGDFVDVKQGTGLVHIAPSHGLDDFHLAKSKGCHAHLCMISPKGLYTQGPFKGQHIFKADKVVLERLNDMGCLLHSKELLHSYPHSWRSKKPLIYMSMPQWFINIHETGIKQKALKLLEDVNFFPLASRARLTSMTKDRPDWLLSRQRVWGTPMTLFVHKETGDLLLDPVVDMRILELISKEGGDAWFMRPVQDFFPDDRTDADEYDKVTDILDVWFDSGCSHMFPCFTKGIDMPKQMDLYLEGSDQHRGWFQSSLLAGTVCRNQAPYKDLVTHGFVKDSNKQKMSKSSGKAPGPIDAIERYGADIVRMWVAMSDYTGDIGMSDEHIKLAGNLYHRIRNTVRYLLGALCDWDPAEESLDAVGMPKSGTLDADMLNKLHTIEAQLGDMLRAYDIRGIVMLLHHFCNIDISSIYLDSIKAVLYCRLDTSQRQVVRAVLERVLYYVLRWLVPIMPFTVQEAYSSIKQPWFDNPIMSDYVKVPSSFKCPSEKCDELFLFRPRLMQKLEELRQAGGIGKPTQADVEYFYTVASHVTRNPEYLKQITQIATITMTKVDVIPAGGDIAVRRTTKQKCDRCWLYFGKLEDTGLCEECAPPPRYTAFHIANYFLSKLDHGISNLKLQKLIFLTYDWWTMLKSIRLFSEPVEAWDFGPVIPSVYHAFKKYGNQVITKLAKDADGKAQTVPESDVEMTKHLDRIWKMYGHMTKWQLRDLTHEVGSPWQQVYKKGEHNIKIPHEIIERYYEHCYKRSKKS